MGVYRKHIGQVDWLENSDVKVKIGLELRIEGLNHISSDIVRK